MNLLSRDQQIQVIGCLTEGMSIRAVERLTGIHRDTITRLGTRVGRGVAELHDRMMVGLRVGRLELDELWATSAQATPLEAHRQPGEGRPIHVRCFSLIAPCDHRLSHWQATWRHDGPIHSGFASARDRIAPRFRQMAFCRISQRSATPLRTAPTPSSTRRSASPTWSISTRRTIAVRQPR